MKTSLVTSNKKIKGKEFVKTSFFIITSKGFSKKTPDLKWERTADFDLERPFATLMNETVEKLLNQMEYMD